MDFNTSLVKNCSDIKRGFDFIYSDQVSLFICWKNKKMKQNVKVFKKILNKQHSLCFEILFRFALSLKNY